MPDWKEMYLSLMRDTEKAIRILTEAQQKCEELYLQDEASAAEEPQLAFAGEVPAVEMPSFGQPVVSADEAPLSNETKIS